MKQQQRLIVTLEYMFTHVNIIPRSRASRKSLRLYLMTQELPESLTLYADWIEGPTRYRKYSIIFGYAVEMDILVILELDKNFT